MLSCLTAAGRYNNMHGEVHNHVLPGRFPNEKFVYTRSYLNTIMHIVNKYLTRA